MSGGEVLATVAGGRGEIVRYPDGSIFIEGWAEAPSGERVRHRQVVAKPHVPSGDRGTVRVRTDSGDEMVAAPPEGAPMNPLERAEMIEAARLRALTSPGSPPWEVEARKRAEAEAKAAREAAMTPAQREYRERRLAGAPLRPGIDYPVEESPKVDRVGTLADPGTFEHVSAEAARAASAALDAWDRSGFDIVRRAG